MHVFYSCIVEAALVCFVEEEGKPVSAVKAWRVKECSEVKEGATCKVQWSDKHLYRAEILSVGK